MTTTITSATATTQRPVRWHTIHFPQPAAWAAFRTAEPVQSCNPHLWRRWARAAALHDAGHVNADASGVWLVQSQYTPGDSYTVVLDRQHGPRCECGNAFWHGTGATRIGRAIAGGASTR